MDMIGGIIALYCYGVKENFDDDLEIDIWKYVKTRAKNINMSPLCFLRRLYRFLDQDDIKINLSYCVIFVKTNDLCDFSTSIEREILNSHKIDIKLDKKCNANFFCIFCKKKYLFGDLLNNIRQNGGNKFFCEECFFNNNELAIDNQTQIII